MQNLKHGEFETAQAFLDYVNSRSQHYSGDDDIELVDYLASIDQLEGYCISSIMRYISRFGKKNGKNKQDLLKAIHCISYLYYYEFIKPEKKSLPNVLIPGLFKDIDSVAASNDDMWSEEYKSIPEGNSSNFDTDSGQIPINLIPRKLPKVDPSKIINHIQEGSISRSETVQQDVHITRLDTQEKDSLIPNNVQYYTERMSMYNGINQNSK